MILEGFDVDCGEISMKSLKIITNSNDFSDCGNFNALQLPSGTAFDLGN